MKRAVLEAYVQRDWRRIQRLKERYWPERKAVLSPAEALAVADALRRLGQALRPDWPTPDERREDLAMHQRVSECLRRVPARSGPADFPLEPARDP